MMWFSEEGSFLVTKERGFKRFWALVYCLKTHHHPFTPEVGEMRLHSSDSEQGGVWPIPRNWCLS